ncbi:MAG: G1 family glutamic endopeptidase, partial [Chloroflexota bacterium]
DQSTDRNVYTLVNQLGQWKISADAHPDQTDIPVPGQTGIPGATPPRALGPGESHNWSGYAASGSDFTGVRATWTVPDGSSGATVGTDATWIGIGGVHSHDLLQAGTEEIVASAGHATFQAWLELLPLTSHPVPLAVAPGNSVSVAIDQQAPGQWKVSFKNNTSGATYSTTVSYTSSLSSADWVEEAPSAGRGVLPLDNFGHVAFSQASATENGKHVTAEQAGAKAITMVNAADQPLAIPSALGKDGASFSVTRTSNPAGQFSRAPARVGLGFGSGHRGG